MASVRGFLVGAAIAIVVRFGIVRSPSDPIHAWLFLPVGFLFLFIIYARHKGLLNVPYRSTVDGVIAGFGIAYFSINLAEGRFQPVDFL